ncbi:MAG: protoporphyrinogen oxidase [Trueperaceae bacterium]
MTALRVVVVGAGIAGLTAAHAIRRHATERGLPLELTVLDRDTRAGGKLQTVAEDGFRIEWAANAFRTGRGPTADLLARLGLEGERVVASPAANRRYVFHGGRLHALPAGPGSLLGFAPLSLAGRWRVFAEPFVARRVAHEESVHDYAARHIGREAAEVLLGTMVRGVYGGDARELSVDAAFPVMREMERDHRSLVIAGIAGARRRRLEGKATWSLRGGMGALMARIAEDLGAAVRLGTAVTGVERAASPAGYRLRVSQGPELEADALILAVPPGVASDWLRPLDGELADEVGAIAAADVAVAALAFPREAFAGAPDGYGFLVAPGEPLDVLGALFESNIFAERAPDGHVLVRVIMGGSGRGDVPRRGDDELVATAVDAIDRAVGLRGAPDRAWVHRQPAALPQYLLGHLDRVARIERRLAELPGLQVAGNAYRGIAVGAIVADAEVVAGRVLATGAAAAHPAGPARQRATVTA